MIQSSVVQEGENYRIGLEGDVCIVTVWRREDLTSAQGADQAQQMVAKLGEVMSKPGVHAMVLDLSAAPVIMGPRTQETITGLLRTAAKLRRGCRVVPSAGATSRLQLERVARDAGAPGAVSDTLAMARRDLRV